MASRKKMVFAIVLPIVVAAGLVSTSPSYAVAADPAARTSIASEARAASPAYVAYMVNLRNNTGHELTVVKAAASDSFDSRVPRMGDTIAPGATYTYNVTNWFLHANTSQVVFSINGTTDLLDVEANSANATAAIMRSDGSWTRLHVDQWMGVPVTYGIDAIAG